MENIQKEYDQNKNKGPTYIIGDWNARLIYPANEVEEEIMGKHTLHRNADTVHNLNEAMLENRSNLIDFATINNLKVVNTQYRKPLNKTATYRIRKEAHLILEQITPNTHTQSITLWSHTDGGTRSLMQRQTQMQT